MQMPKIQRTRSNTMELREKLKLYRKLHHRQLQHDEPYAALDQITRKLPLLSDRRPTKKMPMPAVNIKTGRQKCVIQRARNRIGVV